MIFYLAALQRMSPTWRTAAIEGASRWCFFRRVTLPLLMPTTLFVWSAVINAFRLVITCGHDPRRTGQRD
jgi:sn-glycerol 3-phosphate transport system permease protein